MSEPIELPEHGDLCDVCRNPIEDLGQAVTREYLGKVLMFCKEKCLKRYLEDPELYAGFPQDEALE
ncbi:MAG: hypothetical protein AAB431_00030 [Patescibacteria group bacterium]